MYDMQVVRALPPKTAKRRLLSTGAAAAVAGCHPVTILQSGELEAVRLGRRGSHRIDADALEEWMRPVHVERT
jgi:hypothetical protein